MKKKVENGFKDLTNSLKINKSGKDKDSLDYFLKINKSNKKYKKNGMGLNSKRPYHSYKKLLDMDWKHVKKRYPGLSPMGDADFDGTRNKFDCKPLDPSRDGVFGKFLNVVTRGRAGQSKGQSNEDYRKEREIQKRMKASLKTLKKFKKEEKLDRRARELVGKEAFNKSSPEFQRYLINKVEREARFEKVSKPLNKIIEGKAVSERVKGNIGATARRVGRSAAGIQSSRGKSKKKKYSSPGRPSGTLKIRINPFTGQPIKIPAVEFYKLKKKFKEQQRLKASLVDSSQVSLLARRGIPPEQAQRIVDTRQLQSVIPEGMNIVNNGETRIISDQEKAQLEMQISPPEMVSDFNSESVSSESPQSQPMNNRPLVQNYPQQAQQTQQVRNIPIQQNVSYASQTVPVNSQSMDASGRMRQVRVKRDIMTGRTVIDTVPGAEKWIRPKLPQEMSRQYGGMNRYV